MSTRAMNNGGLTLSDCLEVSPAGVSMGIPLGETLCRITTGFGQDFHVFRTENLGWIMTLNGQLQNCQTDIVFYHEIMAHVPLFSHGRAEKVLVAGGASGALVGEVLKHPNVQIDVVEIDREVRVACAHALPDLAKNFTRPNVTSYFEDIFEYLAKSNERYDVIFLDLPDFGQDGPVGKLSLSALWPHLKRALNPHGLIVAQSSVPFFGYEKILEDIMQVLEAAPYKGVYGTISPMFPGGFQTFAWASYDFDLESVEYASLQERWNSLAICTNFYNPGCHIGALAFGSHFKPT